MVRSSLNIARRGLILPNLESGDIFTQNSNFLAASGAKSVFYKGRKTRLRRAFLLDILEFFSILMPEFEGFRVNLDFFS